MSVKLHVSPLGASTFAILSMMWASLGAHAQSPAQVVESVPSSARPAAFQATPIGLNETAPKISTNHTVTVSPSATSTQGLALTTQPAPTAVPNSMPSAANQGSVAETSAPWTLPADNRPGGLIYYQSNPLNALFLTLPTEKESRFMLPGNSADILDRARNAVSRFFTDNIAAGVQVRARNLESISVWAQDATTKKSNLPNTEWARYQFNQEALESAAAFREKVTVQSAPQLAEMAGFVRAAVEQISPVMGSTGAYELKMQWYNILVQLKEGIALYQTKLMASDAKILAAVQAFDDANPRIPRPVGDPPPKRDVLTGAGVSSSAGASAPALDMRVPAKEAPRAQKEQSSAWPGLIIAGLMLTTVLGVFFKLRAKLARSKKLPSE